MNGFRKALLASAFLFSGLLQADTHCSLPPDHKTVQLGHVIDGDTVELANGQNVRLIGINTPERGNRHRPAEPLANEATEATIGFLGEGPIKLVRGNEARDRHGRLLAHLFNASGDSLEAALVSQGLAFPVAIAPNLQLRDCLNHAAVSAQAAGLGVWSHPYFQPRPVTRLAAGDGGFGRYRGRVSKVGENRNGPYLELDQTVYLPITAASRPSFDLKQLQDLKGQPVEVRGWLSYRQLSAKQQARNYRAFVLRLTHPDMLIPLSGNRQ